jgi:hypothetical protein
MAHSIGGEATIFTKVFGGRHWEKTRMITPEDLQDILTYLNETAAHCEEMRQMSQESGHVRKAERWGGEKYGIFLAWTRISNLLAQETRKQEYAGRVVREIETTNWRAARRRLQDMIREYGENEYEVVRLSKLLSFIGMDLGWYKAYLHTPLGAGIMLSGGTVTVEEVRQLAHRRFSGLPTKGATLSEVELGAPRRDFIG